MKMKKITGFIVLITAFIVITAVSAHAQQPIPIGPGDGDGHTTPIGGLAVLAALGGGYAVKKLRNNKKN